MKRNGKSWTFFALQLLFMLVVPCVFIWLQYGELTVKYKISVTAIMQIHRRKKILCSRNVIRWLWKRI